MNASWRPSLLIAVFTSVMPAPRAAIAQGIVGEPVFNPANGHYYSLFISAPNSITFPQALAGAAAMSHLGIPGHLGNHYLASRAGVLDYYVL